MGIKSEANLETEIYVDPNSDIEYEYTDAKQFLIAVCIIITISLTIWALVAACLYLCIHY